MARVIFGNVGKVDAVTAKASGKLEAWLGGGELESVVALAWADAAEQVFTRYLQRAPMKAIRALLKGADALLSRLGATDGAHRSRFLAAGHEQRLGRRADVLAAGSPSKPPILFHFVSDHGHAPELGTLGRGEGSAERWREAGGDPQEDEVLLAGPRVLLGDGQRVIAPSQYRPPIKSIG